MGIYDRDYYRKEGPSFLESIIPDGRVCRWLIGVNLVIFALQIIFQKSALPGLGLHHLPDQLPDGAVEQVRQRFLESVGFVTSWLQLDTDAVKHGQVWRLLTYAFLHDTNSIYHIAFNMLFLWWLGTEVEVIYGPREFLAFYLVSAFLGGLAFQIWAMAGYDQARYCVGASGAVTAVLLLCACHYPQKTVLLFMLVPVPIWILVIFSVGQDLFFVMQGARGGYSNGVASVVHLTGAAFGFLYYKQQWRVLSWLPDFTRMKRRQRRTKLRLYRPESAEREAVPVATTPALRDMDEHLEAKLDAVLEKVGRQGQGSLTAKEREILQRASEIYRKRRT